MNSKNLLYFLIGLTLCVSSCVSNKKLTYLKHEGELKDEVVYDSVYRTTPSVPLALNTIRPFDQILVEVKTVTPPEYNPFAYVETIGGMNNISNIQHPEQGSLLGYTINEDGDVDLPLIGNIKLAGLTFSQAEFKIKEILDDMMDDPAVRIKHLNFRYSIIGEVMRPGIYGTYSREMSILEAVAKAGGIKEFGDRAKVKLLRKNGPNITTVYLNLNDETFINSPYYYLQQEDVLVILPLKRRPTLEYVQKNVSIVASITAAVVSIVTLITVNR
ncbi:polysaccharide biosynthesis/export family protein [Flammeovirga sp. EKP202]|uniref:polysaccharide biosynthesis/export family protein n=1 Tax=Flammeovirga sp. EKP202 TaxID=2770592 RepID=UPI00165FBDCA|nr:polysaccharide biosynthesis/export family protein [Flammeovirga sp. EKP202]MBD0404471.1 polysaccharide biosynthesis/export family protein [Flammeovirga sp. EKP202]